MPLRRRPLIRAAMVGDAGYEVGKRRAANAQPPTAADAQLETERIEALTKLKSLLDSGVLTREQYESERLRLTEGM
jgi:hypothetical protein